LPSQRSPRRVPAHKDLFGALENPGRIVGLMSSIAALH
jgi:hypothetical protein